MELNSTVLDLRFYLTNQMRSTKNRAHFKSASHGVAHSSLYYVLNILLANSVQRPEILHSPGVNFINIKRANFLYETSFWQLFSSYMYMKKWRLFEKFVRLRLMKLTPGVNPTKLFLLVNKYSSDFSLLSWNNAYLLHV